VGREPSSLRRRAGRAAPPGRRPPACVRRELPRLPYARAYESRLGSAARDSRAHSASRWARSSIRAAPMSLGRARRTENGRASPTRLRPAPGLRSVSSRRGGAQIVVRVSTRPLSLDPSPPRRGGEGKGRGGDMLDEAPAPEASGAPGVARRRPRRRAVAPKVAREYSDVPAPALSERAHREAKWAREFAGALRVLSRTRAASRPFCAPSTSAGGRCPGRSGLYWAGAGRHDREVSAGAPRSRTR